MRFVNLTDPGPNGNEAVSCEFCEAEWLKDSPRDQNHYERVMAFSIGTTLDVWWPPTKRWMKGKITQKLASCNYSIEFEGDHKGPKHYHLPHFKVKNVNIGKFEKLKSITNDEERRHKKRKRANEFGMPKNTTMEQTSSRMKNIKASMNFDRKEKFRQPTQKSRA